MTIDKLDWSKLKPYATDARRSFEELCYQLVRLERGPSTRLVRVDGSGGDGGVEFYETLPSGDELGWQAKFFWPDVRLTPGRKKQIKESLQKACIEHPRLVSWTLITPSNLTTSEQEWFDKELRNATHNKAPVVPKGRAIDLVHVSESEVIARLASPTVAGLRTLFFGDIELSLAWFQKLAGEAVGQLRRKFLPTLHSATSIDTELEQVLGEESLSSAVQQTITALAVSLERLASSRSAFDLVDGLDADATAVLEAGRLASEAAIASLKSSLEKAQAVLAALHEKRWRAARDARPLVDEGVAEAFRTAWQVVGALPTGKVDRTRLGAHDGRDWDRIEGSVEMWTSRAWQEVADIDALLERLTHSAVHVLGAAGQGKTHVSAHQVTARLKNGRPAVLLLGARFTSDEPIEAQILKLLHLEKLGWDDFIAALAACAETYGVRIPIVIDGLNEALREGGLSPVWQNHLAAACAGLEERTDSVVFVTTCRGSYEEAIWNGSSPALRLELNASTNYDVRDAIDLYFEEYKIVADPTSSPLEHFQHPIYLRIFCEAFNREKASPRVVSLGEETLFRVFQTFLDECDGRARKHFKRMSGVQLVGPALQRLGALLWDGSQRNCPMSEAAPVIEGKALAEIDSDSSLISWFEQEDVLILRDWWGGGERVGFVYDLMGGYCIARELIERQRADPTTLSTPEVGYKLFSRAFGERHPLADDIVRALAVLCPVELGARIHNLVRHKGANYASVVGLFEGDPALVDDKAVKVVAKLFASPENRRELVRLGDSVATNPKHPLNAALLSRLLATLPVPERDSAWTEYVRQNGDSCRRKVKVLEDASRAYVHGATTLVSKPRLQLLAQYVQWVLTTTVRPLRDEATRALYWFGRAFPNELLDLTKASLSFNDFYVPERLLAAQYGVMMARAWERGPGSFEEALPTIARAVFDLVFARGAPFPLVHALARDFAQNTVRRALVEKPSLLTAAEKKLLIHPFRSIPTPEWPVLDDPNEGKYRNGNSPLGMDFANYTLGRLVPMRGNYDFNHPEYKKVRGQIVWRISELGYTLERFGDVDQEIAQSRYYRGRSDNPQRVDRYGKKYAWIAFYELAGIRSVKGLLKTSYDDRPRMSDIDIEPSFPTGEREPHPAFVPAMLVPPLEPVHTWLKDGGVPNLQPLLTRNDIIGNAECVLLDGYVSEQAGPLHATAWVQSFIVSPAQAKEILAAAAENRLVRSLSHAVGDHYTFAGEYPWLPEIDLDDIDEIVLRLPTVKRTRVEENTMWFRDGKEIGVEEIRDLLFRNDRGEIVARGRGFATHLDRQMKKHKIAIVTEKKRVTEDVEQSRTIQALRTVRDYSWESYHTTTAEGRNFSTLTPVIARALSLHVRPDAWELFESDGTQVTRNVWYGEAYGTEGSFVYARRSTLEKYLAAEGKVLLVVAAGERFIGGDHMELAHQAYALTDGRGEWDRAWVVIPESATTRRPDTKNKKKRGR